MSDFSDEELMRFTGDCLQAIFSPGHPIDTSLKELFDAIPPLERVNVTLRTRGLLRGSMSAHGDSLGEQLRRAVEHSVADTRFGSRITIIDLPETDLEVWLQTASRQVTDDEMVKRALLIWGVEGIEIRADERSAYYKPSVPITTHKDSIERLMGALCKKARLPKNRWHEPAAVVLRTSWRAVTRNRNHVMRHNMEQRMPSHKDIGIWLRDSVAYLINSRQANGDFTYLYDPLRNAEVLERPSRVRSAGCLYALSAFLDGSPDPVADEVRAQIVNLAKAQVGWTIQVEGLGRVMPDGRSAKRPKMGATALLALALGGDALRPHFAQAYRELAAVVEGAQMPNHRFQTHLGEDEEVIRSSEFFSGQALLTLIQRAERGDSEAMRKAAAAFETYRDQFLANPTSAFAGWHVDVWTRMAALTGHEDFAEFAFHMVDWLLLIQIEQSDQTLWVGGFSASSQSPKFSSIVFLEAVVRAYRLARHLGIGDRQERYGQAVRIGAKFCSVLRINEHYSVWLPNPERSRGGVALTPTDLRIRCDVPQHFITLAMCLLDTPELLDE